MGIRQSADYQFLREEINSVPGISCHDHMQAEAFVVDYQPDIFDILFSSVNWVDLVSAGLPQVPEDGIGGLAQVPKPRDLESLWQRMRPWLDHVREAATFTTRMRGVRDLHDFDEELDDSNYLALSAKITAAHKPGWLYEVLHNRGGIKAGLNDMPRTWATTDQADRFYVCNIMRMHEWTDLTQEFRSNRGVGGKPMETLSDNIESLEARLEEIVREGVIGIKMSHAYWRTLEFDPVTREVAEKDFPSPDRPGFAPKTVQDFMVDWICRRAGELGLPVAFHTGYQYGNGGNIRLARAQLLASLIRRNPNTQFDIFHISYPYCEEAMMLAKYFPNAYFDFCFAEFVSPSKIIELLHIGLELLPSNKMFGWGADTGYAENHHGSLLVTRDCIAHCLAQRIDDGLLTRDRAVRLQQKLMHDNANDVYRVDDWREKHPVDEK